MMSMIHAGALALVAAQQGAVPEQPAPVPVPAAPVGLPGAVPTPDAPVGLPGALGESGRAPAPTPATRPRRGVEAVLPARAPVGRTADAPARDASVVAPPPEPRVRPSALPEERSVSEPARPADIAPDAPAIAPPKAEPPTADGLSATQPPSQRNLIAILAIALGLAALAFWVFRRKAAARWDAAREASVIVPAPIPPREAPLPAPPPVPSPAAPARPAPAMLTPAPRPAPVARAWLDVTLEPLRAGVNLVTATADIAVKVRNTGSAAAKAVRVDIRLLSARAVQDEELAALFATPIARPVAAAFDLEPGEERRVRTVVTLPREALNVLHAAQRPMFVPVAAVNVIYAIGGGATGQTAAAFVIGVERAGAAKLMPIWLDTPSRMYDTLGQRPHALALRG